MALVHPKDIISGLDDECIQPNAVDIRVKAIFKLDEKSPFLLSDEQKIHRKKEEVKPTLTTAFRNFNKSDAGIGSKAVGEYYRLEPGVYEFETAHWIEVPSGKAGWIVPRSTLNRNGVFITSGLYDSGFKNYIGGTLHVRAGVAYIAVKSRIGQFILADAETVSLYEGGYNAP